MPHDAVVTVALTALITIACTAPASRHDVARLPSGMAAPARVVDLGTAVTEDLPERVWGKALLARMGFTQRNSVDVRTWSFAAAGGGVVAGSNAYYTLFNHGGPHVDAPNHFGLAGGIDTYPIEAFSGPLKVFDARRYPIGRSVPIELFRGRVGPGDIVLAFTGFAPPGHDRELPQVRTLTRDAAEFLATRAVRAYGTDAFSVDSMADTSLPLIHQTFLSRLIPIYEQLANLDQLLEADEMLFVGVPVNVRGGDGMLVRPVVFVY